MAAFFDGKLYAPYYIFLRCAGEYADWDLLERFGLGGYKRVKSAPRMLRYAIIADDGTWTLLADDWFYTLWHKKTTRSTIEKLAEQHDIFACSVGDCDRSFDFVYYQDGRLVRKFVVADPNFRGGTVVENFGEPLPAEADAFKQNDELRIVLELAASLGIKTQYTEAQARIYGPRWPIPPLTLK